ncbi:MAG: hypothetical protein Kow0090_09310 [Myxococcota bacterium]
MEPKRILLVEDEKDIIALEKKFLEAEGFEVHSAAHAPDALLLLEECEFDLIVSDIMMPEMSGFEFAKILRTDEKYIKKYDSVPILFVTAKNDPEDFVRGFDSGAVAYLCKPFSRGAFLKTVKLLLSTKHSFGAAKETEDESEEDEINSLSVKVAEA